MSRFGPTCVVAFFLMGTLPLFAAQITAIHHTGLGADGRLRTIEADLTGLSGSPGEQVAAVLRAMAPSVGTRVAAPDLVIKRVQEAHTGWHARLEQRHQGLRVLPSEALVHLHPNGRTVRFHDNTQPPMNLDVTPTLSQKEALEACRAQLAANLLEEPDWGPVHKSELIIHAAGAQPRLAWLFYLDMDFPSAAWFAHIDAHSGEMIEHGSLRMHLNGTGRVFIPNPIVKLQDTSLTDDNDSDAAVPPQAYDIVTLQGLDGSGYLRGDYVSVVPTACTSPNIANEPTLEYLYTRAHPAFEQVMAYYWVDLAQRDIQALGYTNVNNRRIQTYVNMYSNCVPYTDDQSFYQRNGEGTGHLQFGAGGTDDAEDAEVILHELWHAMQDNMLVDWPGPFNNVAGHSLAEGYADMWAVSYLGRFSDGFQDWCFAEWDEAGTIPPGDCLRRLDNDLIYPADYVNNSTYRHHNGTIWGGALYRIWRQIGYEAFSHLMIDSNYFLPYSPPSMQDAADVWLVAGQWRYRHAYDHIHRFAFEQRGLLDPLDHANTPLAHKVQAGPLVIAANNVAGDSSSINVTDSYALTGMRVYFHLEREDNELDQARVTLTAPNGQPFTLYDGETGGADSLFALEGTDANGTWTLHVVDTQAGINGKQSTLHWWGMDFQPHPTGSDGRHRLYE